MSVLSQISRYRELRQRRDSKGSMGMEDIMTIEVLEQVLRREAMAMGSIEIPAVLSTNTVEHALKVRKIGPDSLVCTGCPGVLPSRTFGLRLDDVSEQRSYLFRVTVTWIDHDAEPAACEAEFRFVGEPVVLNWGRARSNVPLAVVEVENKLSAA